MLARFRLSAIFLALIAVVAALLSAVGTTTPAQAVGETTGGSFVPVSPFRLVNTLNGTGGATTPLGGNGTRSYTVLGQGDIPTTGVSAVVLDVAVKSTTAVGSSYLKVWASGASAPSAANLFYSQENTQRSNTVISKVGSDGKVSVFNYTGSTHFDVDVQGYFTATSDGAGTGGFVAIDPVRVASSPAGFGVPAAKLAPGASIDVQVTGEDTVPSDATAVFANVEVRDADSSGGVRVGPGGASTSTTPPTINYSDSGPLSSGLTVKLSSNGKIRLTNDTTGDDINFRVDIQGYFTSDPAQGGSFTPLPATTVYQSTATGNVAIPASSTRTIQVTGIGGLPDDGSVDSVALNVVAVNWSATGSLTVFNSDSDAPATTSVGFVAGQGGPASASLNLVQVSDSGTVSVRNTSTQPVDFYLSTQGWFTASEVEPSVGDEPEEVRYNPAPVSVRSASESHSISFPVDLGSGETLVTDSAGRPTVRDSASNSIGYFESAWAVDNNGVEIPSTFSTSGGTLTQTLSPAGSPAYPILVVPFFVRASHVTEDTAGAQGVRDEAEAPLPTPVSAVISAFKASNPSEQEVESIYTNSTVVSHQRIGSSVLLIAHAENDDSEDRSLFALMSYEPELQVWYVSEAWDRPSGGQFSWAEFRVLNNRTLVAWDYLASGETVVVNNNFEPQVAYAQGMMFTPTAVEAVETRTE